MEQVARSLTGLSAHFTDPEEGAVSCLPTEAEAMREAAILWSKMCLQTFRDELLRKGLFVSAAVADFLAELEAKS